MKKAIVVLYAHPEAYPPTLNAMTELAGMFEKITLLFRPNMETTWAFADNVELQPSGPVISVVEQGAMPLPSRMKLFLNFVKDFQRLCKREKPEMVLLYDPLALLVYSWAKKIGLPKFKVWYHNHDVLEEDQKRFSLNWWALRAKKELFPKLDIFSLPAQERKKYFPMDTFSGDYFFLPNLPAVSFYRQFTSVKKDPNTLRVIFQGAIGKGHGIEEILDLMPVKINGRPLHLILKGWVRDEYKNKLLGVIEKKNLKSQVEFVGFTAYEELPALTASCHIGIGIHTKADIMNKTLGTASNKIYEYAAVGLPVLYYDNEHFTKHLRAFNWAIPTDVSRDSLVNVLGHCEANFTELSNNARNDFLKKLNFENHFKQIGNYFSEKRKLQLA